MFFFINNLFFLRNRVILEIIKRLFDVILRVYEESYVLEFFLKMFNILMMLVNVSVEMRDFVTLVNIIVKFFKLVKKVSRKMVIIFEIYFIFYINDIMKFFDIFYFIL